MVNKFNELMSDIMFASQGSLLQDYFIPYLELKIKKDYFLKDLRDEGKKCDKAVVAWESGILSRFWDANDEGFFSKRWGSS